VINLIQDQTRIKILKEQPNGEKEIINKNTRETMTYGGSLINRVGNRSGNRSGIFVASRDPHFYWGLIVRSVIVLYRRTINYFLRGWLLQRNGVKWRL
jgi:hypothetical protein